MLSYSFHVGSNNHAISNAARLKDISNHNLRKFKENYSSESYIDLELSKENEILRGTENAYKDVTDFYQDFFEESRIEYNQTQTREDRKIYNYFQKIEEDKKKNVAVEIIIQVGDMEHWKDKSLEERKKMTPVFERQLEKMEEIIPNFKICNAVIHYDESSPHIQVIGVPISENCKRGLQKQVSKNSVFSKEKFEELQDKMRSNALDNYNQFFGTKEVLKVKEKGRLKNYDLKEFKEFKEKEKEYLKDAKKVLEKKENMLGKTTFSKEEMTVLKKSFHTRNSFFENTDEIKLLERIIDEKREEKADLEENVEELEKTFHEKNLEISERLRLLEEKYAKEKDEMQKVLDEQKKTYDEINEKIELLEQREKEFTLTKEELNRNKNNLTRSRKQLERLENNISSKEKELSQLTSEIEEGKKTLKDIRDFKTLKEKHKSLLAEKEEIEQGFAQQRKDYAENEKILAAQQTKIEENQEKIKTLENVEGKIKTYQKQEKDLSAKNTILIEENLQIQKKYNDISVKYSDTKAGYDDLIAEREGIKEEIKDLKEEKEELEQYFEKSVKIKKPIQIPKKTDVMTSLNGHESLELIKLRVLFEGLSEVMQKNGVLYNFWEKKAQEEINRHIKNTLKSNGLEVKSNYQGRGWEW